MDPGAFLDIAGPSNLEGKTPSPCQLRLGSAWLRHLRQGGSRIGCPRAGTRHSASLMKKPRSKKSNTASALQRDDLAGEVSKKAVHRFDCLG